MRKFSIGVDLGGTNLRIAAVDEKGTLLEKVSAGTEVSRGRSRVIEEMCNAIRHLMDQHKSSVTLTGVGIGIPGIIDAQTGTMRATANLPGWAGASVRQEIEQCLGCRVILENDAKVAALGEKWLGAGKDIEHLMILTLGTGVGGGIVLNGRIWPGTSGMAGEAGHITLEPGGVQCGCGNHGCAEQYVSATAIMRMYRNCVAAGGSALPNQDSSAQLSARSIYNLATQGDEDAKKIFGEVGRYLGILLGDLINLLDLPMYILGGGAAGAWDAFSPSMFAELRRRSTVYAAGVSLPAEALGIQDRVNSIPRTIITRALLGGDAGLYGAARLAMLSGP